MKNPIDLVHKLIREQFPLWKKLEVTLVPQSGWDNRMFRLGKELVVRLPSAKMYEPQVEKEQMWLPQLQKSLPLKIPKPVAIGNPGCGYPWKWSIYEWIEGEPPEKSSSTLANELAEFLMALQKIDTHDGPLPGKDNFYRGGDLHIYDNQTREALKKLQGKIDTSAATKIWEEALASKWDKKPVWVHGDIAPSNLLTKNGHLLAVLDFGLLAVGDPACDYAINWTFFNNTFPLAPDIYHRARGWALWKALLLKTGTSRASSAETARADHTLFQLFT